MERCVWLRCYGIPIHAWGTRFFEFLSALMGVFMHSDDITLAKIRMDAARIKIITRCSTFINEAFSVSINDVPFKINVVEEAFCQLEFKLGRKYVVDDTESEVSSDSLEDDVDGEYDNPVPSKDATNNINNDKTEEAGEVSKPVNVESVRRDS